MELTDDEYEIVVFAVRVARVQQIQSVDALRSTLRAAFPTTEAVSIDRAVKYLGNRLVDSEIGSRSEEGVMYIRPSLVDEKIDGFLRWKTRLEKEDFRECGGAVKRPPGELHAMYQRYLDFQRSPAVCEKRNFLYG